MAEILAEDEEIFQSNEAEIITDMTPSAGVDLKPVEEATTEAEVATPEEVIPEKYQGKSLQELISMHQNAESALGRQSGEVGELRKTVDDYILTQSRTNQVSDKEEVEPDFFTDPTAAIQNAIAKDPVRQEMVAEIQQGRQERAVSTMLQRHPKMKETFEDSKFTDWVQAKPHRLSLLARTDQYDLNAADELLGLYGDYTDTKQQVVTETTRTAKQERSAAVKSANTGNVVTQTQPRGKPIYRRADIIKLSIENPDRYEQLEDEILLAYHEKRVR